MKLKSHLSISHPKPLPLAKTVFFSVRGRAPKFLTPKRRPPRTTRRPLGASPCFGPLAVSCPDHSIMRFYSPLLTQTTGPKKSRGGGIFRLPFFHSLGLLPSV